MVGEILNEPMGTKKGNKDGDCRVSVDGMVLGVMLGTGVGAIGAVSGLRVGGTLDGDSESQVGLLLGVLEGRGRG